MGQATGQLGGYRALLGEYLEGAILLGLVNTRKGHFGGERGGTPSRSWFTGGHLGHSVGGNQEGAPRRSHIAD